MKTKLIPSAKPNYIHTFPALYKDVGSEMVVLATSMNAGMVLVASPTDTRCVGDFSRAFVRFDITGYWERLPVGAQLVLENDC